MPKSILVSVKDPTGIDSFLRLVDCKWNIFAIEDTAHTLHGCRIPFTPVNEVTGYNMVREGEVEIVVIDLSHFSGFCVGLIDRIGILLLREAVANGHRVTAVSAPDQYDKVIQEVMVHGGVSVETRENLAIAVFELTSLYDQNVLNELRATTRGGRHFLL